MSLIIPIATCEACVLVQIEICNVSKYQQWWQSAEWHWELLFLLQVRASGSSNGMGPWSKLVILGRLHITHMQEFITQRRLLNFCELTMLANLEAFHFCLIILFYCLIVFYFSANWSQDKHIWWKTLNWNYLYNLASKVEWHHLLSLCCVESRYIQTQDSFSACILVIFFLTKCVCASLAIFIFIDHLRLIVSLLHWLITLL